MPCAAPRRKSTSSRRTYVLSGRDDRASSRSNWMVNPTPKRKANKELNFPEKKVSITHQVARS